MIHIVLFPVYQDYLQQSIHVFLYVFPLKQYHYYTFFSTFFYFEQATKPFPIRNKVKIGLILFSFKAPRIM